MLPARLPLRGAARATALGCALVLTGCVSFSTFQGPETVERGEVELGVGALGWAAEDEGGLAETALMARYGISDRADVGMRFFGIPAYWGGLYADAKYQFTSEPAVSGVMGMSYFSIDDDGVAAFYPMLLAGTGRLHGGVRYVLVTGEFSLSDSTEDIDTGFPGFVVGGTFGSRVRMMPEVNLYFGDDVLVFPGLAVQLRR